MLIAVLQSLHVSFLFRVDQFWAFKKVSLKKLTLITITINSNCSSSRHWQQRDAEIPLVLLQVWIPTPNVLEFHYFRQNVLDLSQVLEKKPSSRTHPRYNTASVLLCNSFVEQSKSSRKEITCDGIHSLKLCYLCVLASTVLQTDLKVERWQCRENKLMLPPTHQKMPTREHIPIIYVISRIYAYKARLKTNLWVFARPISFRECLWVLNQNPFVKREFATHGKRKMQRKNA